MNWEAVGAIGEIIGAVAVVVTLAYLAAQMKINTTAINRSASQSIMNGRAEAIRFLASDDKISDLVWRGGDEPETLSDEEWKRFYLIANASIKPFELAYLDFTEGRMQEDLWIGQRGTLEFWFSRPGFQRWLTESRHTLTPQFRALIEEIVRESNAKSDT